VAGRSFPSCSSAFSHVGLLCHTSSYNFEQTSIYRAKLLSDLLDIPFVTGHYGPRYSLTSFIGTLNRFDVSIHLRCASLAMNDQWQSKEAGRSTNVASPSGPKPFLIRPSLQDAIRPGTVASRIQSIQKLASPSPPRSHPPPISITRGEDSRTGFGRRVSNRFGKPALVNTNPDEELHMETVFHSYLGMDTPRVTHQQRHAISSHRTKYARSPGINGQIISDGMKTRMQHDAAVPWGALSRSHRTRSMCRHAMSLEPDMQTESSFSRTEAFNPAECSGFRSDDDEARNLKLYRWNIESRPQDTINSAASNATTSTIRRQSVRDLFKDFGIERPAGLVSRGQSYEVEETFKQAREKRLCHACLRINTRFSITCSRCSHKLCFQCDELSPLPGSREKKASGNKKHEHRGKGQASKENWIRHRGLLKESNFQTIETQKRSSQETLKPRTKVPDEQHVDLFASQKNLSPTLKEEKSLLDEPSAMPFRIESQVPSHVKDSPFLIADQLASSRSLASHQAEFPAKDSANNDLDNQTAQIYRLKDLERQQGISSSSGGNQCNSQTCRATHRGHQPYKHALSCEKRHRYVHNHTDEGYSADTSGVEDANHVHSKLLSHTTEHRGWHSHKAKATPGLAHVSGPSDLDSKLSGEQVSEFVECRGYPRTGHSHLGSPVSSGIIGECQHCLHDCHCDSCKSAYHSVRCCVHGDHQAKVHHHLTPKKWGSLKSEISSTAVKPNASSKSALYKSMAVDSPTPELKVCTEQKFATVASQATKCSARQKEQSEKPQTIKRPSLSKAIHSSPKVDNVTKPPTPPPWEVSPRKHSILGIVKLERWQEKKREDSENVSSVKAPGDPVPSNERLASPPTSTCDEEVPEDSCSNFHDQLTTSRYDREHEHSNAHRQIYRRPSIRSIVEKSPRPANTGPPLRMKALSPSSRRASRRLSALFQLQEKTSVPLLNQKLLEHQEELRRNSTRKDCEDKLEGVVKKLERFDLGNEHRESDRNFRAKEKETARVGYNKRGGQKEAAEKTRNRRSNEKNKAEIFTDPSPEEKLPASTAQRSQKESDLKNIAKDSLEPYFWDKARGRSDSKLKFHETERVEKTRNMARDEQGKAKTVRNEELVGEETSFRTCNKTLDEGARAETVIKKRPGLNDRVEIVGSGDTGTARKKAWEIRLIDRWPSPVCVNDGPVEQHPQADCEVASREKSSLSPPLEWDRELSPTETEEHNCVWKARLMELEQIEGLGIHGVTVLLHLDRREDVIFGATEWKGGELKRED
jgi:hypothetical protein